MSTGEKYTLNVFTNLSDVDIGKIPIKATLDSFEKTFSLHNLHAVNFFIHPRPFRKALPEYKKYIEELKKHLPRPAVHLTHGLANGYVKSIIICETDYCFQLEHDWQFLKENISHSDIEILGAMRSGGIHHLRFNRGRNVESAFDHELTEETAGGLPLCRTPGCSNNPHFLDRKAYLEKYLHLIDVSASGSGGIEQLLHGAPHCCIYGPPGHPPAIEHIDGRVRLRKLRSLVGPHWINLMMKTGVIERAFRLQDRLAK
jgi:hypothetical protein